MKNFLKIFFAATIVLICGVSCSNPFTSGGTKLALRLPYFSLNSSQSRNADTDAISFTFKVDFVSHSGTYTKKATGRSGETLEFSVPVGDYTVELEAFDSAGKLCYKGSSEATVVADETTEVEISLKKAFESQSEHLKVETCDDGIRLQLQNLGSAADICGYSWVNLDDRDAGIRIVDFDPRNVTERTYYYPITQKGRRYDILCELVAEDGKTISHETVSAIAGGGDDSLLRLDYSIKTTVNQTGLIKINKDPIATCLSRDLSKYEYIGINFVIQASQTKDYEWENRLAETELVYDSEREYLMTEDGNFEITLSEFVENGYNMKNKLETPEVGAKMQGYRYGFGGAILRIKVKKHSDQVISTLGFHTPVIELPASGDSGNGGGGNSGGSGDTGGPWPESSVEYNAEKESAFLNQIQNAEDGDTICLDSDLYIKTPINTSKNIIIDGDGNYGIVLDDTGSTTPNAGFSFTNVTFQNGAGASTISGARRFGMIYWRGKGSLTFTTCNFKSNSTSGNISGGALALFGQTNQSGSTAGVSITGCTFEGNTASTGAAIDIGGNDKVTISNCSFVDNNGQNDIFCGEEHAKVSGSQNTASRSNGQTYTPYAAYSGRDSSLNPDGDFWTTP